MGFRPRPRFPVGFWPKPKQEKKRVNLVLEEGVFVSGVWAPGRSLQSPFDSGERHLQSSSSREHHKYRVGQEAEGLGSGLRVSLR